MFLWVGNGGGRSRGDRWGKKKKEGVRGRRSSRGSRWGWDWDKMGVQWREMGYGELIWA